MVFLLRALFILSAFWLTWSSALAAEKYCFILPALSNPYWQTVKLGIEDTARQAKVAVTVLTPASDQAKEEFLNLCQAAIAQRPSLVGICTTTDSMTLQCLRQVQSQGIKVAVVDQMISASQARKTGVTLSYAVGTDNLMVGAKAAQFIGSKIAGRDAKIFVLEGFSGNTNSIQRVQGFKQELSRLSPKAKIVASMAADWDRLKALNTTTDVLARTPDLNVVYAANDMMALGAAEAIRIAGKTAKVTVLGVDGVADARKAILAGRLTASVAQLPYLIGKRSVELAIETVKGKPAERSETVPLLVLTKSVLENQSDPLFKYVR